MKKIVTIIIYLPILVFCQEKSEKEAKSVAIDLGDTKSCNYFKSENLNKKDKQPNRAFFDYVYTVTAEVGAFTIIGKGPELGHTKELDVFLNTKGIGTDKLYKLRVVWEDCDGFIDSRNSFKVKTSNNVFVNLKNNGRTYNPLNSISLITVPFKIRPKVNDDILGRSTSGLNNVGVNFGLGYLQREKYFFNGKKSTKRASWGLLISPSVETIKFDDSDENETDLEDGEESNQFFISGGLTLNYIYNGISFTLIPIGVDIATSSIGRAWDFNGKPWFGFGIGLEPKFLQPKVK